jgi:hypothetical protein
MLNLTLLQSASTVLVSGVVFILIIIFYFFGLTIRKRIDKRHPEFVKAEIGAINGTLLGLLGLLLAFTFSMSSSRYDTRRNIVIEEANDIGTAILRADLYPDSIRQLLRNNFKEYVEARIGHYEAGRDWDKTVYYFLKADSIGKVLWNIVTNDARVNNVFLRTGQMIPALNAMIDVTTSRRAAGESTVPDSIMYFLFILCFCSAFLLGYDNKSGRIDWILVSGLAIMLSITVYNIIDLDRTRSGFINMDVPNQKIVELRGMFSE